MAGTRGDGKDTLASSAREFSKDLTRSLLKGIYERAARDGKIPTPEAAIAAMHDAMLTITRLIFSTQPSVPERAHHHYIPST